MKYQVTIGNRKFEIAIDGDNSVITINGRPVRIDYKRLKGGNIHSLLADNIAYEFELEKSNGGFNLWHGSGQIMADVVDEKTDRFRKLMGDTGAAAKLSLLKAPMPGLVLKIEVEVGGKVKKGDGLMIVEAMKMENELRAVGPGIVKEIKVNEGQAVEKGETLIVFE